MNKENEALSPWEALFEFTKIWNIEKITWIMITIILVIIIHSFVTKTKYRPKPDWIKMSLWIIAMVGGSFIMYMVIWDMLKDNLLYSLILLVGTTIFVTLGFISFFRNLNLNQDSKSRLIVYRISVGVIVSTVIFSLVAFMGMNKQDYGISVLMGVFFGGCISMIWFSASNMNNSIITDSQKHKNDEDDDEIDYSRKIGTRK